MFRLLPIAVATFFATSFHGSPTQQPAILLVNLDGVVHRVTADIVGAAIEQAERENCRLVLIRLNTPGGFANATRTVTEKFLASPIPVIVWVGPTGARAASAGFFLLEAADVAAMAPGTHTGAAHPVLLVGTPDPTLMKKIENDAAAEIRSVVGRRGRNVDLAEEAVTNSRSFSDQEALDNSLVDLIAPDIPALLRELSGREITRFNGAKLKLDVNQAAVHEYQATISQRLQSALSDPNLALALILLGVLGIYIEFTSPGLFVPGVAGSVLLLLGLSGIAVLPVTWAGITLLLLAVALFALEVKVTSHGVLGFGGIVAMILGATVLIDSPIPDLRIHTSTAVLITLPFGMILALLAMLGLRATKLKPSCGSEAAEGQMAVTVTPLAPTGSVLYHGELWTAHANTPVPKDTEVLITALHDLQLEVEPAAVQPAPERAKAVAGG